MSDFLFGITVGLSLSGLLAILPDRFFGIRKGGKR